MVIGPSPGPAPAAHAPASTRSMSWSSWRVWPKVKARSNVRGPFSGSHQLTTNPRSVDRGSAQTAPPMECWPSATRSSFTGNAEPSPGGCFFAGAVLEVGTRPDPVKKRVAASKAASWRCSEPSPHRRSGTKLPPGEDSDDRGFELNGITQAADAKFVATQRPRVWTWSARSFASDWCSTSPSAQASSKAPEPTVGEERGFRLIICH